MANQAVTLLTALVASMARIEQQGNGLGMGGRNQNKQTGEDIQQMIQDRELQRKKVRLQNSEFQNAIRMAKTQEDARKAVQKHAAALTALATSMKKDITSVYALKGVVTDLGKAMRDFKDKDLLALSKSFAGMPGIMAGLEEAVKHGSEGIDEFQKRVLDQTIAADKLVQEYKELQDVLASTGVLTQKQQADAQRAQQKLYAEMQDRLSALTGETATSIDDAAQKLERGVDTVTSDISNSASQLTKALSVSGNQLYAHNKNFGLFSEKMKSFANNPILKLGGAALGAHMLLGKGGNDGSSIIGDYFSKLTTGVDASYGQSSNAAAALGVSINELKNILVKNGAGGSMTSAEMGTYISEMSKRMGPNTKEYQSSIAAAGGNEQFGARVTAEMANLAATGQNTRGALGMAQRTVLAGRALQDAGITTTERFAELGDMIENNSTMFATLYAAGRTESGARKNWLQSFLTQNARMGFSTEQVITKFQEAAQGLDKTFKQRTEGMGGTAALMGQVGGNGQDIQQWMLAKQTGNAELETRMWAKLTKEMAPGMNQMRRQANAGDSRAIGWLSSWAEHSGSIGTSSEVAATGTQAAARAANYSEAQKASMSNLDKMSAHGNDAFDSLKKGAKALESTAFGWSQYISSLGEKNSVAHGAMGLGTMAAAMTGQAVLNRMLNGAGSGGLFSRLGGMVSRVLGRGTTAVVGSGAGAGAGAAGAGAGSRLGGAAARLLRMGGGVGGKVLGRGLGVLGAGLAAYNTYEDSVESGQTKNHALARATGTGLGTVGGALAGAAIGTAIFPVVGTAIGAIAGGYFGGKAGDMAGDAIHNAVAGDETAAKTAAIADKQATQMGSSLDAMLNQGAMQLDELKSINKGVGALVGFSAATNIKDPMKRDKWIRSYRADTFAS